MVPLVELRNIYKFFGGLCAVTLTSMLASLWPAAFAARLEPAKAMRK